MLDEKRKLTVLGTHDEALSLDKGHKSNVGLKE